MYSDASIWDAFLGIFPSGSQLWGLILFFIGYALGYFIPTFVAYNNNKRNKFAIFVLNWFLGWTVIGWMVALIWAVMKEDSNEKG